MAVLHFYLFFIIYMLLHIIIYITIFSLPPIVVWPFLNVVPSMETVSNVSLITRTFWAQGLRERGEEQAIWGSVLINAALGWLQIARCFSLAAAHIFALFVTNSRPIVGLSFAGYACHISFACEAALGQKTADKRLLIVLPCTSQSSFRIYS